MLFRSSNFIFYFKKKIDRKLRTVSDLIKFSIFSICDFFFVIYLFISYILSGHKEMERERVLEFMDVFRIRTDNFLTIFIQLIIIIIYILFGPKKKNQSSTIIMYSDLIYKYYINNLFPYYLIFFLDGFNNIFFTLIWYIEYFIFEIFL